jgi:hypothetical protein
MQELKAAHSKYDCRAYTSSWVLRTYIYWHHHGEGYDHHPGVIDPLARDDQPDDEGHLENNLGDGDIHLLQDLYPYARKVYDFGRKTPFTQLLEDAMVQAGPGF